MSINQSDAGIWQAALAGDSVAWKKLVRRYQSLVYTVALRAKLSMADAADCFQQTWLSLYENRKKIKDPDRLSAWLVTTARREAIRLSRKASQNGVELGEKDRIDNNPLPDEELELLERQAQLGRAIQRLDERCRDLVRILFFAPEDFSYEQISRKLGIAFNSLGPIRKRCLERLKNILKDQGYGNCTK
jgi:RNA polymerase sigma factor (sigma-70 family)